MIVGGSGSMFPISLTARAAAAGGDEMFNLTGRSGRAVQKQTHAMIALPPGPTSLACTLPQGRPSTAAQRPISV